MLLDGQVVLVTGAGRGIGACIARVCAQYGAVVAVNYGSSADKAAAVVAEIEAAGGTAAAFGADVRDADAVQGMVESVTARFGPIWGLVNNAIGGRQDGSLEAAEWQDFQDMLDFGCKAVVNTVSSCRPVMKAHGGGRVVNIVTELWNLGSGGWATYLSGKGAMVGLSRSLANELGPDGITVNMVAPGWMITERVDPEGEGSKRFGQTLPVRWHGSADEIGRGCVFFLSELAAYVTGAYLPVTGGRVTQMGG